MFSLAGIKNIEGIEDKMTLVDVDISKKEEIEKVDKNINFIFHLAVYPVPNLCEKIQKQLSKLTNLIFKLRFIFYIIVKTMIWFKK